MTDALSHCLNVLPSKVDGGLRQTPVTLISAERAVKLRGCLDEQEEVRWQKSYELGVGVVRQLKYRNGEFVATLKCSVA